MLSIEEVDKRTRKIATGVALSLELGGWQDVVVSKSGNLEDAWTVEAKHPEDEFTINIELAGGPI